MVFCLVNPSSLYCFPSSLLGSQKVKRKMFKVRLHFILKCCGINPWHTMVTNKHWINDGEQNKTHEQALASQASFIVLLFMSHFPPNAFSGTTKRGCMGIIFEQVHAGDLDTVKCTLFCVEGCLAQQEEHRLYSLMTWLSRGS